MNEGKEARYFLHAVMILIFLIGSERHACAYIDPGTGSMFLQSTMVIAIGLGVIMRRFGAKLLRPFQSLKRKSLEKSLKDGNS